ncbi:MAG: choice-of-anchor L domain-containing protein [Flavobacteriales bacterium]|nr:choice-of-anchor L domain-containing protein [Flavobacteriales bacterium]
MRCIMLSILLSWSAASLGQTHATMLPASPDYTALVNDHLAGQGVTVLSAGFQFLPYAIGTFTDTMASIGMSGGLVLATGLVHVIEAPNLSQSTTMAGLVSGQSDADLLQLLVPPAPQWDAAILTIDLIPAGDSLQLRFVFGSEEYDEYVCSIKNDVMGIFLSGPGIDGSFTNDGINMATLPATGLPVCVNTVNLGVPGSEGSGLCWAYPNWQMDTVHYVDNFFGPNCGLDGYTEVLTAKAAVQLGAVYQLKIAIADAHDGVYDSAVFLEAGSLTSELSTGMDAAAPVTAGVWYADATGEVVLRGPSLNGGRVEVQAFDAAGRCVARANASPDGVAWRAPMALAAGCYAIRAVQKGAVVSGRVVVE